MQPLFIIDTNVLVAGLISGEPTSPTARILDAMLDGGLLYVLSPAVLTEYRAVLLRPRLRRAHGLAEAMYVKAHLTSKIGDIIRTGT
ncbi:putative toxin-antitoxin system toxin component, PIN family [Azoarcus sp. PA01]|nr:putative toxin-antitoxin system toxin component, PIN family [Azoarcus sp. PA01]